MKRSDFAAALASTTIAATVPAVAATRPSKPFVPLTPVPGIQERSKRTLWRSTAPGSTEVIPTEHTFGDPVYFVWDKSSGAVTLPGTNLLGEINAMYPGTTKTVYVSLAIPYLHASSYFTKPPSGNPRIKEVIQFKPTVRQIQELPELQKQPLSWSPVMKFDSTNRPSGYMYSGQFRADAVTALQALPIQSGLGSFSFPYAGTALNVNHLLSAVNSWLTKLNALGKVTNGVPGLVINASTIVAFGIAQNVVDQVSAILSNGAARNEMAIDDAAQLFAVSQVAGAHVPTTLRIPQNGITFIIVPGGGLHPGDSQANSFYKNLQSAGLKVSANPSGDLFATHPDGTEAAGFFDPFNYAVIDVTVTDTPPVA